MFLYKKIMHVLRAFEKKKHTHTKEKKILIKGGTKRVQQLFYILKVHCFLRKHRIYSEQAKMCSRLTKGGDYAGNIISGTMCCIIRRLTYREDIFHKHFGIQMFKPLSKRIIGFTSQ